MKSLSVKLGVILIAITFIFLFASSTYAGDLDKPYSPTRKEWLQISIFQLIKVKTDPWQHRIGFITGFEEKTNAIWITLTSANGQDPLTTEAKNRYVEAVKGVVEEFLKTYNWSKDSKVFVQFI